MQSKLLVPLCLAALAAASWVSFGQILGWYFTDVDTFALIATGRARTVAELATVLSSPLMGDMMPNARFFRPVASLSWGLDHRLWGLQPGGYHATDLLLHTLNAQLLFWFARSAWRDIGSGARTARSEGAALGFAFLVALLFTVNPAQAEFVPAIARRADLLAMLFTLLTLNAVLSYLRRARASRLLLAAVACFLALLSKETAIICPASALLLLAVGSDRTSAKALLVEILRRGWPLLLVTIFYLTWRSSVLGGLGGYASEQRGPSVWHETRISASIATFLLLTPGHLNSVSAALSPYFSEIGVGALVLLGGALVWTSLGFFGKRRRLSLWLVGSLSGLLLLPLGAGSLVPRQMYLHSAFFALALGLACVSWPRRDAKAGQAPTPTALAFSAAQLGAGVVASALLLSASPLFGVRELSEPWRTSSAIAEATLKQTTQLLAATPPGSTVFLVNFPYQIEAARNPRGLVQPETGILLEHSVQGFVDLQFESRRLDVIGLTYLTLEPGGPEQLRSCVSFAAAGRTLHVRAEQGAFASLFPWASRYGRHDYAQIFKSALERWPTGQPTGRGIKLWLNPRYTSRPAVFVVYTAAGVQLLDAADFQVGDC